MRAVGQQAECLEAQSVLVLLQESGGGVAYWTCVVSHCELQLSQSVHLERLTLRVHLTRLLQKGTVTRLKHISWILLTIPPPLWYLVYLNFAYEFCICLTPSGKLTNLPASPFKWLDQRYSANYLTNNECGRGGGGCWRNLFNIEITFDQNDFLCINLNYATSTLWIFDQFIINYRQVKLLNKLNVYKAPAWKTKKNTTDAF